MDQTFMTIHNLSPEANVLFASESILDILGYHPHEVQNRSCFDFFHPDEVPFARSVHNRGVLLDKAAVLHYCRILSRDGQWISCECCFTVVHDVMVACTSIYRRDEKSQRRAIEAPQIRRLFSSSPRDPRYHMLEHLSPKFRMPPMEREPRAALILNRFTRTLTVMFATNAVATILGVRPDQIKDKSFYECIQENCLPEAIRCLESAKANDSIAYLRFWYRDPRRAEDLGSDSEGDEETVEDEDNAENGRASGGSSDSEDGGVQLYSQQDLMEVDGGTKSLPIKVEETDSPPRPSNFPPASSTLPFPSSHPHSGSSSTAYQTSASQSPFPDHKWQSRSSRSPSDSRHTTGSQSTPFDPVPSSFELEAVVSCTSDGLVVVLRKARPPIPASQPPLKPSMGYENGLFAAPWGRQPIRPHEYSPEVLYNFAPPLVPHHMPLRENIKDAGGPPLDQLMRSIRDVAVFAWALIGINGNLAAYTRGIAQGEAQPRNGRGVWDPNAVPAQSYPRLPEHNDHALRSWAMTRDGALTSTMDPLAMMSAPSSFQPTGIQYEEPRHASALNELFRGIGASSYTYTSPTTQAPMPQAISPTGLGAYGSFSFAHQPDAVRSAAPYSPHPPHHAEDAAYTPPVPSNQPVSHHRHMRPWVEVNMYPDTDMSGSNLPATTEAGSPGPFFTGRR